MTVLFMTPIMRWVRLGSAAALWGAAFVALAGLVLGLEPAELFRLAGPQVQVAVAPRFEPREAEPEAEPEIDAEWAAMTHQLSRMALAYSGRVGVFVKDLNTGREWSYNADTPFPAASLVKVPIMTSVFRKISDGDLSLSRRLALRRRDRIGGSGQLKWFRDGSQFTVREILLRMMRDSDNTAMNMLIRETGLGYVQRAVASLGLEHTKIHADGLSLRSGRVREENYTTAREMSFFLEKMHRSELVDGFSSGLMLELMSQGRHRTRLSKRLPVGWQIAHKTGLLRRACHDVGLVTTPKGTFVVAVLTGDNRSYWTAKDFISKVGAATFAYYQGDYGLYARASHPADYPAQTAR